MPFYQLNNTLFWFGAGRPARVQLVLGGLEDVPGGAGARLGQLSGGAEHQILAQKVRRLWGYLGGYLYVYIYIYKQYK